jgi:hypothetical protein
VTSASSRSEVRHLGDLDQATRRLGNVHSITVLLLPPMPCLFLPTPCPLAAGLSGVVEDGQMSTRR